MTKDELSSVVDYIVKQGVLSIQKNIDEQNLKVSLVDIFAKNKQEYDKLLTLMNSIGKIVNATKNIYSLNNPFNTVAGKLHLIKIRIPDKNKPYRGAPDFEVINKYDDFKKKYLKLNHFNLIVRPNYEMIELVDNDFDVLVYFPNITFSEGYFKNQIEI